ncbi:MAG: preprotein translocase subunit SecG [Pirellulaceae bacterium]
MQYLIGTLIFLTSLFLIMLVLIQRGRGGGLAGAFGGMGGQSAFGTKAGDLFTRVTVVVAAVWILLGIAAIKVLNQSQSSAFGTPGSAFSGGASSDTSVTGPAGGDAATGAAAETTASPGGSGDAKAEAEAPAGGAPATGAPAPSSAAPAASAAGSPAAGPAASPTASGSPASPPPDPAK